MHCWPVDADPEDITMRCLLLLSLLFLPISLSQSVPQDKTCKDHPKLVGKCFKVHGRLSVYNGAPALRLFNLGTRRVLGISEQRFAVPGYRNVPEEVTGSIDQDTELIGDFVVCPFTKQRPGEMQLICINSVTNLKTRQSKEK